MNISEAAKISLLLKFNFSNSQETKSLSPKEFSKLLTYLKSSEEQISSVASNSNFLIDIERDLGIKKIRISRLLSAGYSLSLFLDKWEKRGIWVLCNFDENYPINFKIKFKEGYMPILFGVGNKDDLNRSSIGIVGPRECSISAEKYSKKIAARCAEELITVISGGAKGIDSSAQESALENEGLVIHVVANDLEKESIKEKNRKYLLKQRLILLSTELPDATWSIGRVMGRNKYIHALADAVIVPECNKTSGGTWAGVIENLKSKYSSVYFQNSKNNKVNEEFLSKGAISIREINIEKIKNIKKEIDFANLTVKDIAGFQKKTETAVKSFLTKNKISCLDYPTEKKAKVSKTIKNLNIERQKDLFGNSDVLDD